MTLRSNRSLVALFLTFALCFGALNSVPDRAEAQGCNTTPLSWNGIAHWSSTCTISTSSPPSRLVLGAKLWLSGVPGLPSCNTMAVGIGTDSFTSAFRTCVMDFQRGYLVAGSAIDGIIGPATWGTGSWGSTPNRGMEGQRRLVGCSGNYCSYRTGSATGGSFARRNSTNGYWDTRDCGSWVQWSSFKRAFLC